MSHLDVMKRRYSLVTRRLSPQIKVLPTLYTEAQMCIKLSTPLIANIYTLVLLIDTRIYIYSIYEHTYMRCVLHAPYTP